MKNLKYWKARYAEVIKNGRSGTMTLEKDAASQIIEDAVQKIIKPFKAAKVLDYGCGAGKKMDAVLRLFTPDKYVGFDEVKEIVYWCKKHLKKKGVRFDVKLLKEFFDVIWCAIVIQHMDDEEAVEKLDLFHSKLRKGGKAYILSLVMAGTDNAMQIFRDDAGYDKIFSESKFNGGKKLGSIAVSGVQIGVWELSK